MARRLKGSEERNRARAAAEELRQQEEKRSEKLRQQKEERLRREEEGRRDAAVQEENRRKFEEAQKSWDEQQRRQEAAVLKELRRPVSPRDGTSFLNIMGVCAVVCGIIAVVAGIAVAEQSNSALPFLIGIGAALQSFLFAAFTFVITGIARNVFAMALRLEEMGNNKQQGD
jgi:hypothetical protein